MTANQKIRTLRFADGSGNVYSFTSNDGRGRLVYSPVTPANSSSGLYSGGEAVDVEVSVEKNTELWNRVKLLQDDKGLHAAGRSMGSGSFRIADPDGNASFLVSMGPQLTAFAEFAQGLRSP